MNNQPCLPTARPIGILDSGVGGLSIWKEIIKELPHESTIYLADSKNCPYGKRSEEEIYRLSKRLIEFLIKKKVKLIVIACNTITVVCIDRLRQYLLRRHSGEPRSTGRLQNLHRSERFWTSLSTSSSRPRGQNDNNYVIPIPIVGLVPSVKVAAEVSQNKKIGILSTPITARSVYQKNLINKFAKDCMVVNIGTDELVPYIERGEIDSKDLKKILGKVLKKFIDKKVDAIALGCSHFPFLREEIRKIMGDRVKVLDSGRAIARQVRRVLTNNNNLSSSTSAQHLFYTTGNKEKFAQVSKKLVGDKSGSLIETVQHLSL